VNVGVDPLPEVRDLVWHTPTTLSLLTRLSEGLFEVRTVSADGSPAPVVPAGTTRLAGPVRGLVSFPSLETPLYVQIGREVVDVLSPTVVRTELPARVTSLRFAG
jgi:hypothetical protein